MLELKSTLFPQVQLTVAAHFYSTSSLSAGGGTARQRDSYSCSRSTIPHRKFGALRTFLWVFLAATVSHPIIEADLLPRFPLLVDLANNNILDTKTGLIVQGRPLVSFVHVVSECSDARSFWGLVERMYTMPRIASYQTRGTLRRGAFERLLLVLGEIVLWKNRCYAEEQERRLRIIFPMLHRLRIAVTQHLDDAFCCLGDQAFLRKWSWRFTNVSNRRLSVRPLSLSGS